MLGRNILIDVTVLEVSVSVSIFTAGIIVMWFRLSFAQNNCWPAVSTLDVGWSLGSAGKAENFN